MGKAFTQKVVLSVLAVGMLVVSKQYLQGGLEAELVLVAAGSMFAWAWKPKGKPPAKS